MKIPLKLVLFLCCPALIINSITVEAKSAFENVQFSHLGTVLSVGKKLYGIIAKILKNPDDKEAILHELTGWMLDSPSEHDELKDKLTDISSQLNALMVRMNAKFSTMERIINQLPLTIDIDRINEQLALTIRRINYLCGEALKYSAHRDRHNDIELTDVANTLTGLQSGGLRASLTKLYDYIVPSSATNLKQSFLDLLNNQVQAKGDALCGDVQSPNQYMHHLYDVIIATEMMGELAQTFGYHLQNKLNDVAIDFELKQAEERHQERLRNYFQKFKESIEQASVVLRPCDPSKLVRDVTYIEMEKLYQKVLTLDYNFTKKESCLGSCEDIDAYDHENEDHEYKCSRIYQCDHLGYSNYCLQKDELRRYQWIKAKSGETYGEEKSCRGSEDTMTDYFYYFRICEVCSCTCQGVNDLDNPDAGTFAINLEWIRSDYSHNKVVTGLRFIKCKPSEISIQIKEGLLLPSGEIDKNSENWSQCVDSNDKTRLVISENKNYVNLDDVIAEREDSVVTGVRFWYHKENDGTHVKLNLEFRKFNYSTGELGDSDGEHSSEDQHTTMVIGPDADSPVFQNPGDQNIPHPTGSTYIRFGTSNFKADAGQTTVPFWDAQPVESNPPVPLNGVGLFYKSSPGYSGFLGLRIHTINYAKFMNDDTAIDED